MKFFRKKSDRSSQFRPKAAGSEPEYHVYSRSTRDGSLGESQGAPGLRRTQRTSRHIPVRRRENSNRASNKAIFLLLFRSALIVILLVGGFLALRWWLNGLNEPTEEDKQQWAENAIRMEKAIPAIVVSDLSTSSEETVSPELIQQRLERWELAEQNLRSAEALNQRRNDEETTRRLGQVLKTVPNSRAAQKMLLEIYKRRGLYAEAVPLCIHLLDQDGLQQDLQMDLLQALQKSGQSSSALVMAERMLLNQPGSLALLSIAAACRIETGDMDAALALFERMLEIDAKNTEALKHCGEFYFSNGDYQRATPCYLELLKQDPQPGYYQTAAICYAQQNEAGTAVIFMGQAASLFGEKAVSPWLGATVFNPIRETIDFRAFADRIVGMENRKKIEEINRREVETVTPDVPGGVDTKPVSSLKVVRPGK